MKKILRTILISFAIFLCTHVQSQSIAPSILNSTGGTYSNPTAYAQFEWSLGELYINTDTAADKSLVVTNGVLQPCTDILTQSPKILFFEPGEYRLFPNVTTGKFELDFFIRLPGQMTLQVVDVSGKVLEKRDFHYDCCNRIERFDLSRYPNGTYLINAYLIPDGPPFWGDYRITRHSAFKVVKISN